MKHALLPLLACAAASLAPDRLSAQSVMGDPATLSDPATLVDPDKVYETRIELQLVRGRFVARTPLPTGEHYNFVECQPSTRVRDLGPGLYKEDAQSGECLTSASLGTLMAGTGAIIYDWSAPRDLSVAFAAASLNANCFVLPPITQSSTDLSKPLSGALVGGYFDATPATASAAPQLSGYGIRLDDATRATLGLPGGPQPDLVLPFDAVRIGQENGALVATVNPGGCETNGLAPIDTTDFVAVGRAGTLPALAIPTFEVDG